MNLFKSGYVNCLLCKCCKGLFGVVNASVQTGANQSHVVDNKQGI